MKTTLGFLSAAWATDAVKAAIPKSAAAMRFYVRMVFFIASPFSSSIVTVFWRAN